MSGHHGDWLLVADAADDDDDENDGCIWTEWLVILKSIQTKFINCTKLCDSANIRQESRAFAEKPRDPAVNFDRCIVCRQLFHVKVLMVVDMASLTC